MHRSWRRSIKETLRWRAARSSRRRGRREVGVAFAAPAAGGVSAEIAYGPVAAITLGCARAQRRAA